LFTPPDGLGSFQLPKRQAGTITTTTPIMLTTGVIIITRPVKLESMKKLQFMSEVFEMQAAISIINIYRCIHAAE
jgi:hypothetical protein